MNKEKNVKKAFLWNMIGSTQAPPFCISWW